MGFMVVRDKCGIALLGALGVALMVYGAWLGTHRESGTEPTALRQDQPIVASPSSPEDEYRGQIERQLETLVAQIKGVGSVKVMVMLESVGRDLYATTITEDEERVDEKDANGGTRTTHSTKRTESPVVTKASRSGDEQIVLIGKQTPVVKGVLVVAEGVDDPDLRLEVARAVSTVLGVAFHRVAVEAM